MPEDPRGTIVSAMMKLTEPTNLAKIAKLSHMSIQHVDYWLRKLEEEGVVFCTRENEQNRYFLQPLFYERDFAENFDKQFKDLYDLFAKKISVIEGQKKRDNIFYTMLSVLHVIAERESED